MDLKTKDFYSTNLITISRWEKPSNGYQMMKKHYIRHLPVTDDKTGEIVGIVSDRDLLAELSNDDLFIGDLMSKHVLAFDVGTPVKKIVDEMIDLKVSSFLIKTHGRYTGIITSEDMLHVLSMVLGQHEEPNVLNLIPFLNFKYPQTLLA